MSELFEDNSGGTSSMRVAFLATLAIIIGVWAYVCICKTEIIAPPDSAVTLVLGLATAKAVQRFAEK